MRVKDPDPNMSGEGRLRFESGLVSVQEAVIFNLRQVVLPLLILKKEHDGSQTEREVRTVEGILVVVMKANEQQRVKLDDATIRTVVRRP